MYLPFSGWHRPQSHLSCSLTNASFHTLHTPHGPPTWMLDLILLGSGLEGQCEERCGLCLPENPSWGTLSHLYFGFWLSIPYFPNASLSSSLRIHAPCNWVRDAL